MPKKLLKIMKRDTDLEKEQEMEKEKKKRGKLKTLDKHLYRKRD